jgi:hypothetical protein
VRRELRSGERGLNAVQVALQPDNQGWISLKGDVHEDDISALAGLGPIEKLAIVEMPLVAVRHTQLLAKLGAVKQFWLWCNTTRAALRHVFSLPGLAELDVLGARGVGKLKGFSAARSLRAFRAYHWLSTGDLFAIANSETLEELGAQSARLTMASLDALLSMRRLRSLDLEGTRFDDKMARRLARSKTIESVDLGATKLTDRGMAHIATMEQLKSLDAWATPITESSLPMLAQMPNLEYLSLGAFDGTPSLDAEKVVAALLAMPKLQRVWLDGIPVNAAQKTLLEAKLKHVRVTFVGS